MELHGDQETTSYTQHESQEDKKEQKTFLHELDDAEKQNGPSVALVVGLIAVVVVGIEIISSWIMVSQTKATITNAESRINDATRLLADDKIKLNETEKYAINLNNAFDVYNQEIVKDKDISPLWEEFKTTMVPNTRLKSVAIDDKSIIKIEGEAKSYVDVANLIASFNKKSQRMKKIGLINLSSGEKAKTFSLSATYVQAKDKSSAGAVKGSK